MIVSTRGSGDSTHPQDAAPTAMRETIVAIRGTIAAMRETIVAMLRCRVSSATQRMKRTGRRQRVNPPAIRKELFLALPAPKHRRARRLPVAAVG
jgi:hypothetical protein